MKTAAEILKEAQALPDKDDLSDHIETIAVLRDKRCTWRDIAKFLSDRGLDVDHTKVYRFALANEEKINRIANRRVNMSKSNQAVIPTASEYVDALNSIKISESQKKMLRAHYMAHNRSITYTQLADAAGFDSYVGANSQYGKLGKEIGEKLGFQFLKSKTRDKPFYSSAIGSDNPNIPDDHEEYQLIMHHELAKALDQLGWFNS
jgi:hypothetical protein